MAVAFYLQSSSLLLVLLLLQLLGRFYGSLAAESGKVLLADLPPLQVELGKVTAGRKSPRVPQMKCDGGSAGCGYPVQPRAMDCINHPTTATETPVWKCRQLQSVSPHFKLSNIRVSCEGYDHQGDKHVLQDSCGVEYQLDIVKDGNNSGYTTASYYARSHGFPPWQWSSLASLFVTLVILASMLYGLMSSSKPA